MDPDALRRLRPEDPDPRLCKICGGKARPFADVDLNRSCEEVRGNFLPPAGVAIEYRRCAQCGLKFTEAFDDGTPADFEAQIYNDRYADVDPDWAVARPDGNARFIADMFRASAATLRILDYGGGNGRLAAQLREAGFPHAQSYDPYHSGQRSRPEGTFDLVTCFETVEHMNDPVAGAQDLASHVAPGGMVIFSTLVQPPTIEIQRGTWWSWVPATGT